MKIGSNLEFATTSFVFRRNTDSLCSKVNRACEILQSMCENVINNKKHTKNINPTEDQEPWVLSLPEKNELINGLKDLYDASDKVE